jgi:hypothetical protein
MRFYRVDFPTVMSGHVVRYRVMNTWANEGEISASRDGVCFGGVLPTLTEDNIRDFKAVLDQALLQHRRLNTYVAISERASALPFELDPSCVVEYRKAHFGSNEYDLIAARDESGKVSEPS